MKLLLLICFLLSVVTGFSQQVAITNHKQNIVYCGVDNPLSALVEGYPCASVVLTTDNGRIEKRSCRQFDYKPANFGPVRIKIWVKKGQKLHLIDSVTYQSKPLPLPVAFLTIWEEGDFRPPGARGVSKKSIMPGFAGIRAMIANFDYDAPFQIVSYSVTGLRSKDLIFTVGNSGAVFNYTLNKYFDTLQTGDRLLISNIICKGPDEKDLKLASLEFKIIE